MLRLLKTRNSYQQFCFVLFFCSCCRKRCTCNIQESIHRSPLLFLSVQRQNFLGELPFPFSLRTSNEQAIISLEACNQKKKKCPKTQTKDNYIVCFCIAICYAQIINSSVLAFLAKFGCPDAHQNCSLFATACDCETGLLKLVHHIV